MTAIIRSVFIAFFFCFLMIVVALNSTKLSLLHASLLPLLSSLACNFASVLWFASDLLILVLVLAVDADTARTLLTVAVAFPVGDAAVDAHANAHSPGACPLSIRPQAMCGQSG